MGAIVLEYSETTLELREVLALFSSMSRSDSSTGTDICVWKSVDGGLVRIDMDVLISGRPEFEGPFVSARTHLLQDLCGLAGGELKCARDDRGVDTLGQETLAGSEEAAGDDDDRRGAVAGLDVLRLGQLDQLRFEAVEENAAVSGGRKTAQGGDENSTTP